MLACLSMIAYIAFNVFFIVVMIKKKNMEKLPKGLEAFKTDSFET